MNMKQNPSIVLYFELSQEYKYAQQDQKACRDRLLAGGRMTYAQADDHPECKTFGAAAAAIYERMEALTPHLIRANLASFGLEDIIVVGVLYNKEHTQKVGETTMSLSDLCGLKYGGLCKQLGIQYDWQTMSLQVMVEKDGVQIGSVDSDGDFNYWNAPDLQTALGWKIATDGGRVNLIKFFDLVKASSLILDTIRQNGFDNENFFGAFADVVREVFDYERKITRFGDGNCGARTILWQIATRQLGNSHQGYPFCF